MCFEILQEIQWWILNFDSSLMLTRTNTSEFGWKFSLWSIRFSICLKSVILASGNRTWCSQLMAEMVKSELIVRADTILTYGLDKSSLKRCRVLQEEYQITQSYFRFISGSFCLKSSKVSTAKRNFSRSSAIRLS